MTLKKVKLSTKNLGKVRQFVTKTTRNITIYECILVFQFGYFLLFKMVSAFSSMPPKRGTTSVRPVPPSTSRTKPTAKPVAAPGPSAGRRSLPVSRGGAANRRGGRGSGQRVEPVGDQKETEKKDKKRTPTQQDIMAIRIQTGVRAFLSRFLSTSVLLDHSWIPQRCP